MTPKEAAEKWSKQKRTTEETVNRWITDGWISYTVEDGVVNIPDIMRPHIIRRDIRVTDKKVRDHILKATNRLKYIDAKAFLGKLNDYEFAARIIELENEGKIKRMANAPSCELYLEYLMRIEQKLPISVIDNLFKGKNKLAVISQGIMKNNIRYYLITYQYDYKDKQRACDILDFNIKDVFIEEKKNIAMQKK